MSNETKNAVNSKNGVGNGATTLKNAPVVNLSTQKVEKPELSNLVIPPREKVLSLNQRLEKLNELNAINERLQSLTTTKEKLGKFKLSTDRNLDRLTIKDGSGNVFETSNTVIIKDVIAVVMKDVEMKMSETEMQFQF